MTQKPGSPILVVSGDPGLRSSLARELASEGPVVTATPEELGDRVRWVDAVAVVAGFDGASVDLACAHTGRTSRLPAASLVVVTARIPRDELYFALEADPEALASAGIASLARIGDCSAPGTIAAAVYAGHEFARGLDVAGPEDAPFRRERPVV